MQKPKCLRARPSSASIRASSLLLLAGLLFASGPTFGTANAEFTGTWRIDLERSDAMNRQGLKVAGTYRLALDGENLDVTRTFEAGGQTQAVAWTLVTDGKPHEIPGMRAPRKARAKWKKDRLTISYTTTLDTPRGAFDLDVTETWQIKDSEQLEIVYTTRLPNRTQTRREVWVREGTD